MQTLSTDSDVAASAKLPAMSPTDDEVVAQVRAGETQMFEIIMRLFMLREVDGLNTAETARQLRVSEGTVKTRLYRAKDVLQRRLHDVTPAAACRFDGGRCDRLVAAVMGAFQCLAGGAVCAPALRLGELESSSPLSLVGHRQV